jgi:hypothetical protein
MNSSTVYCNSETCHDQFPSATTTFFGLQVLRPARAALFCAIGTEIPMLPRQSRILLVNADRLLDRQRLTLHRIEMDIEIFDGSEESQPSLSELSSFPMPHPPMSNTFLRNRVSRCTRLRLTAKPSQLVFAHACSFLRTCECV